MRCHPPRGRPKPVVYWKRNGRKIDGDKDKNYMITNEGHLILVAARLSDTGNYTCIAENIANLRPSNTAQLTVYGKTIFPLFVLMTKFVILNLTLWFYVFIRQDIFQTCHQRIWNETFNGHVSFFINTLGEKMQVVKWKRQKYINEEDV